jgi:hypothetical protein
VSERAECAAAFVAAAEADFASGATRALSDADLAAVMTAAVRLYAQRAENADAPPTIVDVHAVSTTDILTAACEMIRLTNVNMFDVSMWFSRGAR